MPINAESADRPCTFALTTLRASAMALGLRINPGIPAKAATPHKPGAFARLLRAHPDSDFRRAVVSMLTHGEIISYCGPHFHRSTPNAATAREHADVLRAAVLQEVTLAHAVGPFFQAPLLIL